MTGKESLFTDAERIAALTELGAAADAYIVELGYALRGVTSHLGPAGAAYKEAHETALAVMGVEQWK